MKKLIIIRTPKNLEDKNSTLFANAIIKQCKLNDIEFEIIMPQNVTELYCSAYRFLPTIILKPCEFEIPNDFVNVDKNTTVKVIYDIINQYDINHNIGIFNRSELIGKPLYEMLTYEDNYTTTLFHSKTPFDIMEKELKNKNIVVLATNTDMNHLDLADKIVIDVDNGYKISSEIKKPKKYYDMREIGRKTVEKIIQNVLDYYNN